MLACILLTIRRQLESVDSESGVPLFHNALAQSVKKYYILLQATIIGSKILGYVFSMSLESFLSKFSLQFAIFCCVHPDTRLYDTARKQSRLFLPADFPLHRSNSCDLHCRSHDLRSCYHQRPSCPQTSHPFSCPVCHRVHHVVRMDSFHSARITVYRVSGRACNTVRYLRLTWFSPKRHFLFLEGKNKINFSYFSAIFVSSDFSFSKKNSLN